MKLYLPAVQCKFTNLARSSKISNSKNRAPRVSAMSYSPIREFSFHLLDEKEGLKGM